MPDYSLITLLKIRERKKNSATINFKLSLKEKELEETKLNHLVNKLNETISYRFKLQENFYQKVSNNQFNRTFVSCHGWSSLNSIYDEKKLKEQIDQQKDLLKKADTKLGIAKKELLESERELKMISKHYEKWQQNHKRTEQLKADDQADDLNSARFILKKA